MNIKNLIVLFAGIGIGSIGTYLVTKNYFTNYMDEELEAQKEYFKANYIKLDFDAAVEEKKLEVLQEEEPNYKEIIEKMNYGEYFPKKKNEEETKSQETTAMKAKEDSNLRVITSDEFATGGDDYTEKVSLYYFEKDGVFMDIETEEVVPNGVALIGEENFEQLGELEDDVLYVRNDTTNINYEVIQEHYAFAESEYHDHGHDE